MYYVTSSSFKSYSFSKEDSSSEESKEEEETEEKTEKLTDGSSQTANEDNEVYMMVIHTAFLFKFQLIFSFNFSNNIFPFLSFSDNF